MSDNKIPLTYLRVSFSNRLYRLLWSVTNLLLFRFTPVFLHSWRVSLLKFFGAKLTKPCYVYPDVKIWSPKNLAMSSGSTLGPNVNCYNCALIEIGVNSTISQDVTLCTGTHDPEAVMTDSPVMDLLVAPIQIKDHCWITAEVFVHPGIVINDGCVVGARSVVNRSLAEWGIYSGFPAKRMRDRSAQNLTRL